MNNWKYAGVAVLALPGTAVAGDGAGPPALPARDTRPNIPFVMTDDQPYDMLGCMGRYPFLETPALDRLAREGVTFRNFFCVQSLSSPSRASFLTGLYPHEHGVTLHHPRIEPDWERTPSYQQQLHENGYQTAFFGKIHMSNRHGADHVRPGYDRWVSFNNQGEYDDPLMNVDGREVRMEGYVTDILTESLLEWLDEGRDRSKPFSVCLWHKAVHSPMTAASRHEGLYEEVSVPYPPHDTHLDDLSDKPEWQRVRLSRRVDDPPARITRDRKAEIDRTTKKICRTLQSVDESLASILEYLDRSGELENTVVVFSSDNGFLLGEHRMGDKRVAYESSMRIPLIVRYPRAFPAGSAVEAMCLNIDVAPTILEAAGVGVPRPMQGRSLLPLLRGESVPWRDSFLYEYFTDNVFPIFGPTFTCVRTERYKLVENVLPYDIGELYDLERDPGEMENLISDPAYDGVRACLEAELERLKTETRYNPDRLWRLTELGVNPEKVYDYPIKKNKR